MFRHILVGPTECYVTAAFSAFSLRGWCDSLRRCGELPPVRRKGGRVRAEVGKIRKFHVRKQTGLSALSRLLSSPLFHEHEQSNTRYSSGWRTPALVNAAPYTCACVSSSSPFLKSPQLQREAVRRGNGARVGAQPPVPGLHCGRPGPWQ